MRAKDVALCSTFKHKTTQIMIIEKSHDSYIDATKYASGFRKLKNKEKLQHI